MAEPVDVVIITAAEGEDTALREVSDGALSGWTQVPPPQGSTLEVFLAEFESLCVPGTPVRVITTRPARFGGDHAANAAGQLITAFQPRCIAMCGVCAGRPDWTQLGDVVIGERVWRYDTGERFNNVEGGRPSFKRDNEQFQLSATWLRTAENVAKEWKTWPGGDKTWLDGRPRPLELQALWLMKELADGRDPAAHPDVNRLCSHWTDVVGQLVEDGLVEDGELTEAGRKRVKGVLFQHKGSLPGQADWALHVGPMATGNHLVGDVDIWRQLEDEQRLVRGFDMELAAIGQAGWASEVPFLAVKGVMDFGLPERHRGFRGFAARASAEVLVRLLRTLVPIFLNRAGMSTGRGRVQNLPRGVAPVFKGRESTLGELEKSLDENGSVVLTGLGGMGKTRLALEYAIRGKYDVCWWVRAANVASLQEDLVKLGQRLELLGGRVDDIEQAVAMVLEWLSTTHDRWLLVLDDAPGPECLLEWLPARGRGHVVITSRAEAWAGVAEELKVDQLAPEASRELLLDLSKQEDDGSIEAVAKELGHLPLALVQAGAFMNAAPCSFLRYLDHLKVRGLQVFRDRHAAPMDYYRETVAATWEISMEKIREQSTAAAALLDWLAFLDPDGVPVGLLTGYPDGLPPEVAACVGKKGLELDPALAVLRRFSMVDRAKQPEPALRVHRLVQAVTRDKLSEERRRELAAAVVAWVRQVFAYEPGVTRIKDVPEGIGEQLIAVGMLEVCVSANEYALTQALRALGEYRARRGMLSAARVACQRSLEVAERLMETDASSSQNQQALSVALSVLGDVELEGGNLTSARRLYQRSLEVAERLEDADPHDARVQCNVCASLIRLGDMEVRAGRTVAARDLFRRCVNALDALPTVDSQHAGTQRALSVSLLKLGEVEMQAGDTQTARELFRRSAGTLALLVTVKPRNHQALRDLAVVLDKLAEMEVQTGHIAAARSGYERITEIFQELTDEDPQNADAKHDLAHSLDRLGNMEMQANNFEVARAIWRRSLALREALSRANPQSARAQQELSISFVKLGEIEVQLGRIPEAHDYYQCSLELREALVEKAPQDFQARRALAISLEKLVEAELLAKNFKAARRNAQRCLQLREGLSMADPLNSRATREFAVALDRLGCVELEAGKFTAALGLFKRSYEMRKRRVQEDWNDSEAAFDVAVALLRFVHLARAEHDTRAFRAAVAAGFEHLAVMHAVGQISGFRERESLQRLFQCWKEELADG